MPRIPVRFTSSTVAAFPSHRPTTSIPLPPPPSFFSEFAKILDSFKLPLLPVRQEDCLPGSLEWLGAWENLRQGAKDLQFNQHQLFSSSEGIRHGVLPSQEVSSDFQNLNKNLSRAQSWKFHTGDTAPSPVKPLKPLFLQLLHNLPTHHLSLAIFSSFNSHGS